MTVSMPPSSCRSSVKPSNTRSGCAPASCARSLQPASAERTSSATSPRFGLVRDALSDALQHDRKGHLRGSFADRFHGGDKRGLEDRQAVPPQVRPWRRLRPALCLGDALDAGDGRSGAVARAARSAADINSAADRTLRATGTSSACAGANPGSADGPRHRNDDRRLATSRQHAQRPGEQLHWSAHRAARPRRSSTPHRRSDRAPRWPAPLVGASGSENTLPPTSKGFAARMNGLLQRIALRDGSMRPVRESQAPRAPVRRPGPTHRRRRACRPARDGLPADTDRLSMRATARRSSGSSTRVTPSSRQTASKIASDPASAPVCERTARLPTSETPALNTAMALPSSRVRAGPVQRMPDRHSTLRSSARASGCLVARADTSRRPRVRCRRHCRHGRTLRRRCPHPPRSAGVRRAWLRSGTPRRSAAYGGSARCSNELL